MSLYDEEQTQQLRKNITPTIEQWLASLDTPPKPPQWWKRHQKRLRAKNKQPVTQGWLEWTRDTLAAGIRLSHTLGVFLLNAAGTVLLGLMIWAAALAMESESDDSVQKGQRNTGCTGARAQGVEGESQQVCGNEDAGAESEGAVAFLASER